MARTFLVLCVSLAFWGVPDQARPGRTSPGEVKALAPGKLLVASRDLRDPNFAERIVLLTDYDKDGAAGLVVNVRTDVSLGRVFEHLSLGTNAERTAFAGGPVARGSAVVLIRSRPGMTGVRSVAAGIDLIATRDRLEQTLTAAQDSDRLPRVPRPCRLGRSGSSSAKPSVAPGMFLRLRPTWCSIRIRQHFGAGSFAASNSSRHSRMSMPFHGVAEAQGSGLRR